jgi:hypothetical protein
MSHLFDHPADGVNINEGLLNAAILGANISEGYEEYLDIFDRFYEDEIEAGIDRCGVAVTSKAALRDRIANFLVPLHVLVEIGGVKSSIHVEPIACDTRNETHSFWTLELTGITGHGTVLKWRACRRWHPLRRSMRKDSGRPPWRDREPGRARARLLHEDV